MSHMLLLLHYMFYSATFCSINTIFLKTYINLHNLKVFTLLFNFFSLLKVIFRLV